MAFSDDELERYARHIVLREVGGLGQRKLHEARILVVGAGGLGSPALAYLAAAGIGRIGIVDDDRVSLSNLQRQIIHVTEEVGELKVDSAVRTLEAINPNVTFDKHAIRLDADNVDALVADYDMVLDGCDNLDTRYLTNAAAHRRGIPLVSGAIAQWEGQVSVFHPTGGAPCYQCIFPEAPAEGLAPSCAEAGVIGALAGVIGSVMATEAIKHITGAGQTLAGSMLIQDALWGESRKVRLSPRADCPVCGQNAAT